MASQNNINRAPESAPHVDRKPETRTEESSKEVSNLKERVGGAAFMETVDVSEESAETMGHVSEVLRESASEDNSTSASGAKRDGVVIDPEELKQRLLAKLPTELEMRRQIQREIRKEIDYLHQKAMKMLRSTGDVNYFEMNNIVKKIRELKSLLVLLVKSSMESMKTLWLRFVHGIM